MRRIVVAITGATGSIYGVRLLELMREIGGLETHLVLTPAGALNVTHELGLTRREIESRADVVHGSREIGASIASGSFKVDAMVVAPCSMKTLAAIAHGYADNLVTRAADVCLKERRRVVLMARETPLNLAHIKAMELVTLMGGIVFPPVPGFYHRPATVADLVDHSVARVLDLIEVEHALAPRWAGIADELAD
ncbi:UbiX family flavin prenyltransferase [soil metagenome]